MVFSACAFRVLAGCGVPRVGAAVVLPRLSPAGVAGRTPPGLSAWCLPGLPAAPLHPSFRSSPRGLHAPRASQSEQSPMCSGTGFVGPLSVFLSLPWDALQHPGTWRFWPQTRPGGPGSSPGTSPSEAPVTWWGFHQSSRPLVSERGGHPFCLSSPSSARPSPAGFQIPWAYTSALCAAPVIRIHQVFFYDCALSSPRTLGLTQVHKGFLFLLCFSF